MAGVNERVKFGDNPNKNLGLVNLNTFFGGVGGKDK